MRGSESTYSVPRQRLVERLAGAGIHDRRVLAALQGVPRHALVPEALRHQAYRNQPLPIGDGQTISAPGVVATMSQALALTGREAVLEIGTGSGYQAAVLAQLAARVVSIERIPRLASRARSALDALGVTNVVVHLGDGTRGRVADAPYDAILVTAGGPHLPEALLEQLAVNGRLVGPFGPRGQQRITRVVHRGAGRFEQEDLGACRFVDLVGDNGWAGS